MTGLRGARRPGPQGAGRPGIRDRVPGALRAWPVQVLLVFACARAVSAAVLLEAASRQGPSPWAPASPDYLSFLQFWDGGWYRRIYDEGYPATLPRRADGVVLENQWAFYPLFPALVRALHAVTGGGWDLLAPVTATACGFIAALGVYRLFRLTAASREALWGVAFVSFLPVSPIFQIPYAESLHLALLAWALYLVAAGRYLGAVPVVLAMGLARPAGVPFALLVFLLAVAAAARLRAGRTRSPLGLLRESALPRLAVLTGAAGAAALAWPAAAWAVTGEADAYLETETAWRGEALAPFVPWLRAGTTLFGPVGGPVGVFFLAAGCIAILRSEPVRRLGRVPVLWCASYLLYLAAFWNPQTSTYRILLPLFPLALAAVFVSRSGIYRWAVLAVFILLQALWVGVLWSYSPGADGGDFPP
jgi:hypothetical protein